ncbi:MAG: SURF1 family cytochrome oxidase biogenesis protein [Nocardioides sp.]
MRSLRFLASRRWVLFALVVVALASVAWILGHWQFGRLEDRREYNAIVERNEGAEPAPVDAVLGPARPVAEADEWRLVTASGTYDVDDTVIVRYRTRDGTAGVDVVVPLVTADGTALLVDRGWLATENRAVRDVASPPPPGGEVQVTGWGRVDATGDSTEVADQSTRAISSAAIGEALARSVYGGFVDLASESPGPSEPLEKAELPDLGEGPHFFYGLQWWFFGLLAIGGFLYLVYDEWRGRPGRRRATDASEGPEHAAVDREHHAGQE